MTSNFSTSISSSGLLINSNSKLNNKSVSNSVNDPRAMCKKWINSFPDFLAAPSAILTGKTRRVTKYDPNLIIKQGIWVYFILLLFES